MLLARLTPGLLCYQGQEAEKCILYPPPPMLVDFPSRLRSMQVAGLFAKQRVLYMGVYTLTQPQTKPWLAGRVLIYGVSRGDHITDG